MASIVAAIGRPSCRYNQRRTRSARLVQLKSSLHARADPQAKTWMSRLGAHYRRLSESFSRRRGLLSLAAGFALGGSGLGAALLSWNTSASIPLEDESKQERRRRKAAARIAAHTEPEGTCAGVLHRWVWFPWWPHWEQVEAEIRRGMLLLRKVSSAPGRVVSHSKETFTSGARCIAIPLAGVNTVEQSGEGQHKVKMETASGERETLLFTNAEEQRRWSSALRGEKDRWHVAKRVVDIQVPSTWEPPFEAPRVIPLDRDSKEFKRVEKLALSQQFRPQPGQSPYVKGKLVVDTVSRVQQPHVWEQYCMRRAIIAAENDGESTERELWHGTPVPNIITKEGFDPRVCSLSGMFGGGVYFADKSTKSVRYAGASKPGDSGTLLLCRVTLGRPMLKYLPQANMRRPPDPFPLFGLEHLDMYIHGKKFHSVFASSESWPISYLIMNEYIVYHTNQGYPEYVVEFTLK